jgi:hypothetical protein
MVQSRLQSDEGAFYLPVELWIEICRAVWGLIVSLSGDGDWEDDDDDDQRLQYLNPAPKRYF